MLPEKKILEKLYLLPEEFKVHMRNKDYVRAKHCYDTALTISVFCQLEDYQKMELFGNRPYTDDEPVDGLFREKEVLKAYEMCIKANQTREYETYPGKPA